MRRFVASGEVPGIIAYVDGVPAGWCSVSPKPPLIGLARLSEKLRRAVRATSKTARSGR